MDIQVTPEMVEAAGAAMEVNVVDAHGDAWSPKDWAPDVIRAVLTVALAQGYIIAGKV